MSPYIIPGLKYREVKKLNADSIIINICEHFDISYCNLKKRNRVRKNVTVRHLCFYFIKKYTDKTLKEIANYFNMDHTTVIHGLANIKGFVDIKDKNTLRRIFEIEEIFVDLIKPINND